MKTGFLFAGQGSQKPGMGKDFYDIYPQFRRVFDMLKPEEKETAFSGPAEKLSDTRFTQPVMVAFAAGLTAVLRTYGIDAKMAAGLSLGEYSALCAAGVFTPEDAIKLVRIRAAEMYKAAMGIECAMTAVLGSDRKTVENCCKMASEVTSKWVQPANYNCPGQIVISGEKEAVQEASALLSQHGAKRCISLPVSGPFHTAFMEPAGKVLRKELAAINHGTMKFPVIFNATGAEKKESETIAELLVKQVSSPVYFEDSLRAMENAGIDTYIEIGPGKALSGFVSKTLGKKGNSVKVLNIETVSDLETVVKQLKNPEVEA